MDDTEHPLTTPDQLARLMESLGLHNAALARIIGADRGAPGRWLSGEVPIPPWLGAHLGALSAIRTLCAALFNGNEPPSGASARLPLLLTINIDKVEGLAFNKLCLTIGDMRKSGELHHAMEPDDFRKALALLGWSQRVFSDRVGCTVPTTSRWANGHNPIPAWVRAHLGLLLEVQKLHAAFVAVQGEKRGT